MKIKDLEMFDEVELEAALVTAQWQVDQIDMEPTIQSVPFCVIGMGDEVIGYAKELTAPIVYATVLVATKVIDGRTRKVATAYDRGVSGPLRLAAMFELFSVCQEADPTVRYDVGQDQAA